MPPEDGDDNNHQSGILKRKRSRPSKAVSLREDATLSSPSPSPSPPSSQGHPPPPAMSDPIGTTTTTKKPPPPSKRKRGGPKSKGPPSPASPPEPETPLPGYFQHLVKLHSALNLVSTFLTTHSQHLPPTLSNLSKALTSKGIIPSVEDIASLKAITPNNIRFEYVGYTSLLLEARGFEKEDLFRSISSGNASIPLEDLAEKDEHDGDEVLVFEFVDGDLKGKGKTKDVGRGEREVAMPRYSTKQVMGVVERRDEKFGRACEEVGVDPEARVKGERVVPERSVERQKERETLLMPEMIPKERKTIPEIVEELKRQSWYTGQIVPDGHRVFEPQEAVHGDLDFLLSQDLVNALYNARGITTFYSHQAEAINALHAGYDVVVSTSTSSGKSLIYQLPVLHALEEDPSTRAMYIFPTKALAQDQRRSLQELMGYMPTLQGMVVETFDGDTAFELRNMIRDEARVVFTNPDMLHLAILPQEEKWRSFLQNLRFVVVDELHVYNGLMGSHVAYVMRRLRRICAALGNRHELRFVSCSATVANPGGHFERIFGIEEEKVRVVEQDGSPSGRKEFLCWNTPYKDPGDPASGRGNAALECARLFCQLILRGVRVISFCRVRAQCEVLIGTVRQELERLGRGEVANRVMGYRGGYTAQDRRKIENEMFEGKLLGIVATTALELGVDIGTLDCVITWGFPYTISNLRQQSGRAGRRNKDSLSILVGDSFATDQHYMNNPDELFTKPNAALQVDLDNMLVKEGHIQCAAYELPIRPDIDSVYFGPDLAQICATHLLHDPLTNFYHAADRFRPQPSKFVSIRDTEEDHFAIVDTTHNRNVVLEELEASRASFTLYDGAIFLHQGFTYLVRDFNPSTKIARVERVKVSWTTKQRDYTDIDPIETEALKPLSSVSQAFYGSIRITQTVFGFFKVDSKTNKILDAVAVDNPPVVRFTKGMWIDIPPLALSILTSRKLHAAGAIHAAQHALMSLIPNFVVSLPGDVRTECKNPLKELVSKRETKRKRPARLTFYDAKGGEGGSGINTKAFEHVELLVKQALERVEGCGCGRVQGCLECVASEYCKEGNEVVSKAGCKVVLRVLLGEEVDVNSLPMGPEEGVEGRGVETVVRAEPVRFKRRGDFRKSREAVQREQKKRNGYNI
ncbi:putative ATP-dependent helicase [Triangularia setosa]|uniref:ATP-dependent helicase n=1 Tax=Triangularia setosa TaxID=2587417 RepID=A0AAN7ADK8_9PEZI|nr:putative ATP-dependent helicase [Podospora setosa]